MKHDINDMKRRALHNADAAYYVMGYLMHAFPVHQMQLVEQEDGSTLAIPLTDANGAPVLSREAVALRDRLVEDLMLLAPIPSALDQLLWTFGPERVAEVTGRSQRPLRDRDGRLRIERRAGSANSAESAAFLGCVSTLYLQRHHCRVAWKCNLGAGAVQAGRRALHKAGGGRPGLCQRAPRWNLRDSKSHGIDYSSRFG